MKLKWIMLIGFGVFLVIVFLAIGVSARFDFSVVMHKPYEFIESFFQQWSPALSAAGSIIAALVALAAILEVRRERRLTILDQQLLRVEEWARDIGETMFRVQAITKVAYQDSTREESLKNTVESLTKELEELRAVKREDPRIMPILQKLTDTNTEILDINERQLKFLTEHIDNIIEFLAKAQRSNITIRPVIYSIADNELKKLYETSAEATLKVTC